MTLGRRPNVGNRRPDEAPLDGVPVPGDQQRIEQQKNDDILQRAVHQQERLGKAHARGLAHAGRAARDNLQQHELPRTRIGLGENDAQCDQHRHPYGKQHLAGPFDLPDHASKRPHIANIVVGHTLHLAWRTGEDFPHGVDELRTISISGR